ncbi:MAG: glycosyltransferase family 4 protein [Candidatus Bipolaricaulaceae bacterium]
MRIGLFSDTYLPQINGVTTTVHWLREELEHMGHEVFVFCPHYDRREYSDPSVVRLPSLPFLFHRESRFAFPIPVRARRLLDELEAVHSHTPFSLGGLALWAARRRGVPHVHTYHTLYVAYRHYLPPPLRPPRRMAEVLSAAFCNRCDAVTVESTPIRDELVRYGVRVPVHVFPFGVNLREFASPVQHSLREDLGVPAAAPLLLYVGRLAREKNTHFLVRAFREVLSMRPDAFLAMVGGGPAAEDLAGQARRLGVAGRVLFPGYVGHDRLMDYYRGADVFVFASKTETQGLVVLEAMAGGLPVVAIGAMGVLDIVRDGENGLFAPEDEVLYARRVVELLEDGALRGRLREGALTTARQLSTAASARRLLDVFDQLR